MIDFISPIVKGVFSMDYEFDDELEPRGCTVVVFLISFYHKLQELKENTYRRNQKIDWIKVIQLEFELTVKTRFSEEG